MQEPRSRHHRKPKCLGGKTTERNISDVSVQHHRAWHMLFGSRQPDDIARLINAVWLDPDKMFVCVDRQKENENQLRLNL